MARAVTSLTDRRQTLKRWREYFANISTVEFAHLAIPCAPPVHGPVQKITVNATITALEKMKSGKATGPDDLAADLWKSKGCNPAGWLTKFFNQVVKEKKCRRAATEHDDSNLKKEGQSWELHIRVWKAIQRTVP
ncbi:hypothetical protein V3C99_018166 [Haemonchus contortus]|uniref:Endonuclease-reverse transcriptase n=1 Tax=Haemonchus contortus TaxID=6289 RepID=A0A7I4Z3P8_HAECO